MSVARSITSSIDPDDLVQESYTRIYQAVLKGGGPNGSFRAYLFTSIRNTAAAWGRSLRETPIDELDAVADPGSTEQAANDALDRGITAQAFRSLPTRWQEVLWYTEIEQMKPAEVAPLLGMKAGAVSQLTFRAREGLREAWIQAHLRSADSGSECEWTIEHLGAYSRGNLSARHQKRVDQHISECARCMIVAAEAKDVSGRLALVLLPLILGAAGAAGYAATLQGAAPVSAAAAMPSAVFEGGVIVDGIGATPGATGLPLDGGGSVGGAAGVGGGGSSGGGVITGIGALVGAGSAALVVAGVVAAAAIVPGLVNASPATSLPSASNFGDSSISSEVEPGPGAGVEDKFVLEIDDDAPKPPAEDDEAPEVELRVSDDPVAPSAPPATPAQPSIPPSAPHDSDDEVTPTEPPVAPEEPPVDPPDEGEEDGNQGGDGDDSDGSNPTEPPPAILPEGTPLVSSASVDCVPSDTPLNETVVTIAVAGAPGASVRLDVVALRTNVFETELDDKGIGSVELRPTALQLLGGVTVRYFAGEQTGPSSDSTRFRDLINITHCLTERAAEEQVVSKEPAPADSTPVPGEEPLPARESLTDESVADMPTSEASTPAKEPVAVEGPAAAEESMVIETPAVTESVTAEPPADETPADEASAPAE